MGECGTEVGEYCAGREDREARGVARWVRARGDEAPGCGGSPDRCRLVAFRPAYRSSLMGRPRSVPLSSANWRPRQYGFTSASVLGAPTSSGRPRAGPPLRPRGPQRQPLLADPAGRQDQHAPVLQVTAHAYGGDHVPVPRMYA
ncbi:putative cytidine deaminase [Streptomyces sp. Tu6071]|nr:putative cytidine deaminase [Streptomyces sp. Tu6071]